jgi:hypothetical protein
MTMTPRQDDEPLELERELLPTAEVVQDAPQNERPTTPVQKEEIKETRPNKKMQKHPEDRLIVSYFHSFVFCSNI